MQDDNSKKLESAISLIRKEKLDHNFATKQYDQMKVIDLSNQQLADKILNSIIELNLDLGRKNDQNISKHTSTKFANFLIEKAKGLKLTEIDNFFYKIACMEFGKVYEVSFASLMSFFKEFNKLRQNINQKKHANTKHVTINKISVSFKNECENDKSIMQKCPYLTGILVLNMPFLNSDTYDSYCQRVLGKIKSI